MTLIVTALNLSCAGKAVVIDRWRAHAVAVALVDMARPGGRAPAATTRCRCDDDTRKHGDDRHGQVRFALSFIASVMNFRLV